MTTGISYPSRSNMSESCKSCCCKTNLISGKNASSWLQQTRNRLLGVMQILIIQTTAEGMKSNTYYHEKSYNLSILEAN